MGYALAVSGLEEIIGALVALSLLLEVGMLPAVLTFTGFSLPEVAISLESSLD